MGKYVTARDRLVAEAAAEENALLEAIKHASDGKEIAEYAARLAAVREEKLTAKAMPSNEFECAFHSEGGAPGVFNGPGRLLIEATGLFEYGADGEPVSEMRFRDRPHYLVSCPECARSMRLAENLADTEEPPDNVGELRSLRDQAEQRAETLQGQLATAQATIEALESHLDALEAERDQVALEREQERATASEMARELAQQRVDLADAREALARQE